MSRVAEQWRVQALYDLETAQAMLKSRRYLYVLFCCQQAVEKSLKAIIVERTDEAPPRIHSLPRLAEVASITTDEPVTDFLIELSAHYIHLRYPEEIEQTGTSIPRTLAADTLRRTEELLKWLTSASM